MSAEVEYLYTLITKIKDNHQDTEAILKTYTQNTEIRRTKMVG